MCADLLAAHSDDDQSATTWRTPRMTRPYRQRRPLIGHTIAARFADGEWHALTEIAAAIEVTPDHAQRALLGMRWTGAYGCRSEKRRSGNVVQWRIFTTDTAIPVTELLAKLVPIKNQLESESRKNMATVSLTTIARLAHELSQLLEEWGKGPAARSGPARRRSSP